MKKYDRKTLCILISMISASVLTACGSSSAATEPMSGNFASKSAMTDAAAYSEEAYYDDSAEMAMYDGKSVESSNVSTTENASTSNRKLIRNASLSVETKEFDALINDLDAKIKEMGGYIENMSGNYGSKYSSYRSGKSANITARIPAVKLDDFIGHVGTSANITSRSESVTDVTLDYVDMESHKKMLIEEQNRLLEFLDQAESIEDIITIEDRLTNVKYQIDSMESQLRTYDNKVDYSTVDIYVEEVIDYTVTTPESEKTPFERMTEGFMESIRNIGIGLREFGIWLVIHLPYIVLMLIIAFIVLLIVRAVNKRNVKRREAYKEEKLKKQAMDVQNRADNKTEFGDSIYVAKPDNNAVDKTVE